MAENIPINAIPNQSVEFYYGDNSYVIDLFTWRNFTLANISMNGTRIVSGFICSPNQFIVPKQTNFNIGGNFKIKCVDNEYPYYTNFNKSQSLEFEPDE